MFLILIFINRSRSSKSQSDILGKNSNQGLDGIPESNSNTDETDGALNGVNDLSGFDNGKSLLEEEVIYLFLYLFIHLFIFI